MDELADWNLHGFTTMLKIHVFYNINNLPKNN
jgi:hypothetical protein